MDTNEHESDRERLKSGVVGACLQAIRHEFDEATLNPRSQASSYTGLVPVGACLQATLCR
jgi:hypothetical protein